MMDIIVIISILQSRHREINLLEITQVIILEKLQSPPS